jgi:hypothetical protein
LPRCGSAAKRYAQEQQLMKLEYTFRSIPASVNVEPKESERSDATAYVKDQVRQEEGDKTQSRNVHLIR